MVSLPLDVRPCARCKETTGDCLDCAARRGGCANSTCDDFSLDLAPGLGSRDCLFQCAMCMEVRQDGERARCGREACGRGFSGETCLGCEEVESACCAVCKTCACSICEVMRRCMCCDQLRCLVCVARHEQDLAECGTCHGHCCSTHDFWGGGVVTCGLCRVKKCLNCVQRSVVISARCAQFGDANPASRCGSVVAASAATLCAGLAKMKTKCSVLRAGSRLAAHGAARTPPLQLDHGGRPAITSQTAAMRTSPYLCDECCDTFCSDCLHPCGGYSHAWHAGRCFECAKRESMFECSNCERQIFSHCETSAVGRGLASVRRRKL